jgi:hypothetical protein
VAAAAEPRVAFAMVAVDCGGALAELEARALNARDALADWARRRWPGALVDAWLLPGLELGG